MSKKVPKCIEKGAQIISGEGSLSSRGMLDISLVLSESLKFMFFVSLLERFLSIHIVLAANLTVHQALTV